jgi:methionyl-tRNA synthetase
MPRYLVTSALPYANGPIHFGHITGAYLPADVYVRTLRMLGEEVLYVCGTDEHGVAITVNAEAEGKPYAEYVAHWRGEIKRTFDRYGIEFDVWSGTSISPPHAELSQHFFTRLDERGYLVQKVQEQLYCTQCPRYLADRYVEGTCYVCGHDKARGDECPKCASWLDPLKMTNTHCKVCGSNPVRRATRHWYLDLPKLRDEHIGAWFAAHPWKQNVKGYIGNQLAAIEPRPITRDMSWGVPLPPERAGGEQGKVLYVWFDAPIGYVSFTREWAAARGEPDAWKRWWRDADTRLVHFIGKDNIPFHCLVFPSMLWGTAEDYVLPWQVPANEFYNLEGKKFSTSQQWTIPPLDFAERFDAESARFYLILSMPEGADSEWRWDEFQACNNSQLADKIGNLASRVLRFLEKNYDGRLPGTPGEHAAELDRVLLSECGGLGDPAEHVRDFRFRRAAETLLANAVVANVYIDRMAPWALRKTDPARAGAVLDTCCQFLAHLARWMSPFLPRKAQALWEQLGCAGRVAAAGWPGLPTAGAWRTLPAGQKLGTVGGLFPKIEDAAISAERAKLGA